MWVISTSSYDKSTTKMNNWIHSHFGKHSHTHTSQGISHSLSGWSHTLCSFPQCIQPQMVRKSETYVRHKWTEQQQSHWPRSIWLRSFDIWRCRERERYNLLPYYTAPTLFILDKFHLPVLVSGNTVAKMLSDSLAVPRTIEQCNLLAHAEYYMFEYNFRIHVNFVPLRMSTPYSWWQFMV